MPYKECELDVSLWADVVEGFFDCPKRSLSETVRAVDDLGYGAKGNVAKLLKVYGINISGASDAPLL